MHTMIVLDNARFIDIAKREVRDGTSIAIEGERIRVSTSRVKVYCQA
jgi:adenine deaminase